MNHTGALCPKGDGKGDFPVCYASWEETPDSEVATRYTLQDCRLSFHRSRLSLGIIYSQTSKRHEERFDMNRDRRGGSPRLEISLVSTMPDARELLYT